MEQDHFSLTIQKTESYHLRVPVGPLQHDSQSKLNAWHVVAVCLTAENGLIGWGYQTGFGPVMHALKIFLDREILPALIGLDVFQHKYWWSELYLYRHHMGLNGPAFQGVSAPEVAAWDLTAKALEVPLWKLLGGRCRDRILCYNTNIGWLGYSLENLVENVKGALDQGFQGIKVKIGLDDFNEDVRRLEAVRQVGGDSLLIATDVNNKWDLQKALKCAPALEDLDIAWLEEPIYMFDVKGHALLAERINTPLLHGECILEPLMFRDMLDADAMDIVQPSEMKLGGISRWLEVAALARMAGKRLVPAGWSMMQIDQHLAAATPHCWMVEWIPWLLDIFQHPVHFRDGEIIVSDEPGAGTEIKLEALQQFVL